MGKKLKQNEKRAKNNFQAIKIQKINEKSLLTCVMVLLQQLLTSFGVVVVLGGGGKRHVLPWAVCGVWVGLGRVTLLLRPPSRSRTDRLRRSHSTAAKTKMRKIILDFCNKILNRFQSPFMTF